MPRRCTTKLVEIMNSIVRRRHATIGTMTIARRATIAIIIATEIMAAGTVTVIDIAATIDHAHAIVRAGIEIGTDEALAKIQDSPRRVVMIVTMGVAETIRTIAAVAVVVVVDKVVATLVVEEEADILIIDKIPETITTINAVDFRDEVEIITIITTTTIIHPMMDGGRDSISSKEMTSVAVDADVEISEEGISLTIEVRFTTINAVAVVVVAFDLTSTISSEVDPSTTLKAIRHIRVVVVAVVVDSCRTRTIISINLRIGKGSDLG